MLAHRLRLFYVALAHKIYVALAHEIYVALAHEKISPFVGETSWKAKKNMSLIQSSIELKCHAKPAFNR